NSNCWKASRGGGEKRCQPPQVRSESHKGRNRKVRASFRSPASHTDDEREIAAEIEVSVGAGTRAAGGDLQYGYRDSAGISRLSWDAGARVCWRSCGGSRRFDTGTRSLAWPACRGRDQCDLFGLRLSAAVRFLPTRTQDP